MADEQPHEQPHERSPEREAAAPRRPYTPPRLTEYGTVESLTAGSRSRQTDGGSGGFRRSE
jgi:hypothetical protein